MKVLDCMRFCGKSIFNLPSFPISGIFGKTALGKIIRLTTLLVSPHSAVGKTNSSYLLPNLPTVDKYVSSPKRGDF